VFAGTLGRAARKCTRRRREPGLCPGSLSHGRQVSEWGLTGENRRFSPVRYLPPSVTFTVAGFQFLPQTSTPAFFSWSSALSAYWYVVAFCGTFLITP
jgi:hypothetical protein